MTPAAYLQKIEYASRRADLEWIGRYFGQQIANGDLSEADQLRIDSALTERWNDIAPRVPCIAKRADEIAECLAVGEELKAGSAVHTSRSTIFPKRKHIASPDREKSRLRRRELGLARLMPDWMANQCVESFRAVAAKLAELHLVFGQCTWPIDRIAAEAGVCPTTVRNFRRWAVTQGHIESIERKRDRATNDTNIVRILSKPWLKWLEKRKKLQRGLGCNGFNPRQSTKEKDLNTADFSRVNKSGGSSKPPDAGGQAPLRECGAPS